MNAAVRTISRPFLRFGTPPSALSRRSSERNGPVLRGSCGYHDKPDRVLAVPWRERKQAGVHMGAANG